jgi:hypothetical protein
MALTSTGLGIGTSSPSNKLHVNSGASTTAALIESTGTNVFTGLKNSGAVVYIGSDNNGSFLIQTPGSAFSTKMLVDTTGNVGIGTSSPSVKLHIVGGARIQDSTSASNYITIGSGNEAPYGNNSIVAQTGSFNIGTVAASTSLFLITAGTSKATLDSSGNLGIGTTSPSTIGVSGYTRLVLGAGSASTDGLTIVPSGTGGVQFTDAANVKKGYLQWDASTGALALGTAGTTKATLDASGNLLVGTTSSTLGRLEVVGGAGIRVNEDAAGTKVISIRSAFAGGDPAINVSTNHPLTFLTNNTERARITSGGDVGIGTTSPATRLDVQSSTTGGRNARFIDNSGVGSGGRGTGISLGGISNDTGPVITEYVRLVGLKTNATQGNTQGYLTFETDGGSGLVERARITAGGFFKASNTGTYSSSTNDRYEFTSDKNDLTILVNSTNTGANVNNVYSQLPAGANAGAYHFVGSISGSGLQFTVDADGDVKNTNNSYGSISDIKLKQDVVDAASQWDDIKALRVRKYRFKRNPDAALQIGLVAQEAEAVSPGLVEETADRDEEGNDLGTTTKSVKYSVLYMKAVKALQEAMTRIEQLEAKVAALESK